jgi:hypothetical protein
MSGISNISLLSDDNGKVLNNDVFLYISTFLRKEDKAVASTVCKHWYALINNTPSIWREEAGQRFLNNRFCFPIRPTLANPVVPAANPGEAQNEAVPQVKTLPELVKVVHDLASSSKTLKAELMGHIADAIILASTTPAIPQAVSKFPLLTDSLKDAELAPIHGAQGEETNNIVTAGLLYLVKAFNDTDETVRSEAFKALKKIAEYSLVHAGTNPTLLPRQRADGRVEALRKLSCLEVFSLRSCNSIPRIKQVVKIFKENLPLLQRLTCKMDKGVALKTIFFDAMASEQTNLAVPGFSWKKSVISGDHRKYDCEMVVENHEQLLSLSRDVANFDANFVKVLKLSKKALRGLVQQTPEFLKEMRSSQAIAPATHRYFGCLNDYLGSANAYNYVLSNVPGQSSTLRKAAVLFIIKGLESENDTVKKAALKVVGQLVRDYFNYGQHGLPPEKAEYQRILFEIFRGFVESAENTALMSQTVVKLFRADPVLLNAFISFLGAGAEKEALKIVVESLTPDKMQ